MDTTQETVGGGLLQYLPPYHAGLCVLLLTLPIIINAFLLTNPMPLSHFINFIEKINSEINKNHAECPMGTANIRLSIQRTTI